MQKFYIAGITVGMLVMGLANQASAASINFDDQGLTGPSTFAAAGPAQTLNISTSAGNVQLKGGVILTNATNLPADETSVYGTASFGDPSLTNPITLTFANPIQNFFLDVLNGNNQSITYTVADNAGNSSSFNLIPNTNSGQKQIGFAATGTQVTITSSLGSSTPFDFFIDNINFDAPLPPNLQPSTPVPEPSSVLSTLAFGVLSAGYILKHQRKQQQA